MFIGLFESYSASAGEGYGVTCPPCLLIHRPACTLDHWLSNARAEATTPAFSDKASFCYGLPHLQQVWPVKQCHEVLQLLVCLAHEYQYKH